MKQRLYLECFSGISGDMMVAALLDLGASQETLNQALKSISVKGFRTRISRVKKAGLDVCDFNVILDRDFENHDHDMAYLYGVNHQEQGDHHMGHNGTCPHSHESHHHGNEQVHRNLPSVLSIISKAEISPGAKEIAVSIFEILAEAEAKAHGVDISKVHFHEVGAIDSIVDIIAVSVCLDNLGVKDVIVPVLYEGTGTVRCQHGILPIPVPAVSNIAKKHGLKLHLTQSVGEFVTPTGAAIVAAIKTTDLLPEAFSIKQIGLGAGKRNHDRPGILRAMLIQEVAA